MVDWTWSHWAWLPWHILVWGLIGTAVYWMVKGNPFARSSVPARAILDERLARGEISAAEYLERKRQLESP